MNRRLRHSLLAFALPLGLLSVTCPVHIATADDAMKKAAATAAPPKKKDTPLSALPYVPSLNLAAMDTTADPCVDFYQYTCGGWIKDNPVPADQAAWGVYHKMADENLRYLWGILEEAAKPVPTRSANEQKIGDYFHACMDEPAIEAAGAKPLKPSLDEIASIKNLNDLARVVAHLHLAQQGSGTLFGFGSAQDLHNSTRYIPFVLAGGLGLPDRDYYFKTDPKSKEILKRYEAHVKAMLELSGETPKAAAAGAKAVMSIETALAKVSLTRVELRDPNKLDHPMTGAGLQRLTPSFSWKIYTEEVALPDYLQLNVTEPKFLEGLEVELKSRKLSDWKSYLRWHAVRAAAPYLSSRFEKADFGFYRRFLRGIDQIAPRWKRCVTWVDRDLGEALGETFVRKTVSSQVKEKTLKMTREVQEAMEKDIQQLPWMGPETKKQALEKLHAMVNKIGWPDRWRDYTAVKIEPGTFFENVRRATIFESRRQLDKIGKPIDRGEWQMTPPTVNAYYDAQMNDMNFPAGILQPPLLDLKLDDAPNYGNTGATIGHELTHGFDDEGRQYDARGNLNDWWTKEDAKAFEERTQCVVDQYAGYIAVDDIHINSRLTLGEDVADLGGTLLAYMAWKEATKAMKLVPIDGFSPDQRFFVGMAQWACSNIRPEEARVRAITDPHSPPKYRVNGVVSNMPEFAAAFSCKAGQPMVREKPCRVW